MGVGIGLSGPPFRKAKWVNHRGPFSYIFWGVNRKVRQQAVDRLIYGQLRSCTDLLWTAIHAPKSPWYNDTGELVACPGEVQRPLCTSNGGNMFKGGLVINFKDGGEICICISHVDFVPDQKPVPSAPIAYAVNKGTYAGHTFTCVPSKGAALCLVPL